MSDSKEPEKTRNKGGRPKGSPNKVTGEVRAMIVAALEQAGGVDYLLAQAHENPKAFLGLVGRMVPIQATVDGQVHVTWPIGPSKLER